MLFMVKKYELFIPYKKHMVKKFEFSYITRNYRALFLVKNTHLPWFYYSSHIQFFFGKTIIPNYGATMVMAIHLSKTCLPHFYYSKSMVNFLKEWTLT